MYKFQIVTDPTEEPVTYAEAKTHLRLYDDVDQTEVTTLITVARQLFEDEVQRPLVTQTWKLVLDEFPCCDKPIVLPMPPIQSITSITYLDTSGVSQTLASTIYKLNNVGSIHTITLKYNQDWPEIYDEENVITITYICGYGLATAVPKKAKQAIQLMIGHLYENREIITNMEPYEIQKSFGYLCDKMKFYRL